MAVTITSFEDPALANPDRRRLQPYPRTPPVWTRQVNGTYEERTYHGGKVRCTVLPGVEIDLDAVFG